MTPHERAAMRAIVGAAARQGHLPAASTEHPGLFEVAGGLEDLGTRIARFALEFEAVAGVVHEPATPDELVGVIVGIAAQQATLRVLAWSDAAIGVPGLHGRLVAAGLSLVDPQLDQLGPRRSGQVADLDAASIGLTGVDAAIAETGSLVVVSGPGRPRLASLLTPVHIAIVRHGDIVPSLRSLVRARPALVTAGSNFVGITGPSRTADIEHTLSRGVHGPGEVHVILVDDE